MALRKAFSIIFSVLIVGACLPAGGEGVENGPPGYKEIPYYLRKLNETNLEEERIQYDKLIHDAVVNADLSSRRVVKDMEPLTARIKEAVSAGLDRQNISGRATWLASALRYYEREKGRRFVDVLREDCMENQTRGLGGIGLSPFPNKILLLEGETGTLLVEDTGIHEAIISPTNKRVAYFRSSREDSQSIEIWMVDVKKKKKRKILKWASCQTLLFSLDGGSLYFQERPAGREAESTIYRLSAGGGRPRRVCEGRMLETLIKGGPWKGHLIIYKNTAHPLGIQDEECPFVVRPNGSEVGRLRGMACR
ncbi:MAG: hypothetical protein LHV69_06625 [Elusimicrobia bacterium]|nr:hypothetical protein [Candidatus Obscuribacterium magneticum]